jgi:hypothetical protein
MTIESRKSVTSVVTFEERATNLGDAAVDGLLAGVAAGFVMGIYLLAVGLFGGERVADTLARFDSTGAESALTGLLLHLAVAAVYGALFAASYWVAGKLLPLLQSDRLGRWFWLPGLLFGLLLWLLANGVWLPVTGSALSEIVAAHFAIAHLLYGITLALLLLRPNNHE